MTRGQKILLIIIGFFMFVVVGLVAFNVLMPKPDIRPDDISVSERNVEEVMDRPEETENKIENKTEKQYINIYFLGKNETNEEVYKAVKRVYNKDVDGSKIRYAIISLIRGPKPEERQRGVYTEIPMNAEIINITEQADKIIINLNSAFVTGGGTESLYKRLYQLIKTSRLNSTLPVYLYIDGQQANVVGGEGIMLTQPLSNSSLEN